MRVGCGSAAIGMFAPQWKDHVDEVIVVDDHITGVLSEHQGGRFLDMKPAGIRVRGRRSTPGRYFQVAQPGLGWGGTDVSDPLDIIEKIDPKVAWPGLKLLMVSTTGEHSGWFVLDHGLKPQPADMPVPASSTSKPPSAPSAPLMRYMTGKSSPQRSRIEATISPVPSVEPSSTTSTSTSTPSCA